MSGYVVIIENEGESWGAYVPDLPGCVAVGGSRAEVEQLIREAIPMHLDLMREQGEEIPRPAAAGAIVVQVA
ncbi:MAG TPA: type II toxin-antitoxin system HicB family antitoxin [Acidimicrobiales bacterium]|nr:type II toxin-antitoxin system HicB family antitoxin [Acidimicrobiales bacterium]